MLQARPVASAINLTSSEQSLYCMLSLAISDFLGIPYALTEPREYGLIDPREHDPSLGISLSKLLLVVSMFLSRPNDHLRGSYDPEQGSSRVQGESSEETPA